MTHTRYVYLDSLRGLAALSVVFVHFMASFLPFVIFGDQAKSASHIPGFEQLFFYPPFGLFIAGQLAVSLFFILSGYVLSYRFLGQTVSLAETLSMTAKRPIRLGGLVWFSMSLFALFWYLGWFQNIEAAEITGSHLWLSKWWRGELDVALFWQDLLTRSFSQGTVYNNPLWTIGFELYGSLLVFAFLLLFSGFKFRMWVLFIMVALFYHSMLVGFWLGVILADIHKNHPISCSPVIKKWLLWILGILFILLSSYPYYLPLDLTQQTVYGWLPADFNFGLGYPMLAALLLFIWVLASQRFQQFLMARLFQYLGKISYAIYVIHAFVIGTFSAWLFVQLHAKMAYGWTLLLVFITGVLASVLLAHLITKWVDGPAIKLARWLGLTVKNLAQSNTFNPTLKWLEKNLLRHPQTPNKINKGTHHEQTP